MPVSLGQADMGKGLYPKQSHSSKKFTVVTEGLASGSQFPEHLKNANKSPL